MVNNTLHKVFVFILVLIVFVNAVVTVYMVLEVPGWYEIHTETHVILNEEEK